ncbi:translational GTPase TypA [Candidatus Saccharibacteria bacterium]|nr:translational GTPase TypA [Candidatus Saccharibacteria bacterium]
MISPDKIRNIAIIAHVDHGKTTLVDGLLKQSHTFRDNAAEMSKTLIMDSGDQERERGITITAKTTAVEWNGYKINIIDTPGHADFSGEVERTLQMADGVLLIVDAAEGPMPQTKFVLSKALGLGLTPIVVINKIDKPARRITEVENEIGDLFLELATNDSQLEYPIYYATARDGRAWTEMPANVDENADLTPIFEAIIREIPSPKVEAKGAFQMLVTSLDYDSFLGKYAVGRITRGTAKVGLPVVLLSTDGAITPGKIDKLFVYKGLNKVEVKIAPAGEIVAITGVAGAKIGETLADATMPQVLPTIAIEQPTLSIYLGPNTSPFKGKEGQFTTSRQIGERLQRELETNVALKVEPSQIGFKVSGRGELHLSVLIEQMRRESYEFEVGRPQVVLSEIDGVKQEPIEEVFVEVAPEFFGAVSQEFGQRHAKLLDQETALDGTIHTHFKLPTRNLIGLRNLLLTATKGTLIMNSLPAGYQKLSAKLQDSRNGALISSETGTTMPYALANAEARGELFIGPQTEVYAGQIVGLNARREDMEINVCKAKHLTNMRSSSSDGIVQLTPFTKMSLEQCLDFINDDELLEVTPKNLRLRKRELDPTKRKRAKNHSL